MYQDSRVLLLISPFFLEIAHNELKFDIFIKPNLKELSKGKAFKVIYFVRSFSGKKYISVVFFMRATFPRLFFSARDFQKSAR